ncbi:MAG: YidC/Oxa1 family membrane protein insertase [Kineosporiaceae bacterium]
MSLWSTALDMIGRLLAGVDALLASVVALQPWSWGAAVVVLTLLARCALLPITVLQVRFLRAMAAVEPRLAEVRARHSTDRRLLLRRPGEYLARWTRRQEEEGAVLREHGIRWYVGLVPPLAQIPVYLAVLGVLSSRPRLADLRPASLSFAADPLASVLRTGGTVPELWAGAVALGVLVHCLQRQHVLRVRGHTPVPPGMRQVRLYLLPPLVTVVALSLPLTVLISVGTGCLWGVAQNALTLRPHSLAPATA